MKKRTKMIVMSTRQYVTVYEMKTDEDHNVYDLKETYKVNFGSYEENKSSAEAIYDYLLCVWSGKREVVLRRM